MAKKYPYDESFDALLNPAKQATFFEQWTPEEVNSGDHDMLAAELARLAYADETAVRLALPKARLALDEFFDTESTQGFIATDSARSLKVLAFRGTESRSIRDLMTDLNTGPKTFPLGGKVHKGFFDAYQTVKARIDSRLEAHSGPLLITGHSLGAALATIAAVYHPPAALITFGSPRTGDADFAAHLQSLVDRGAVRRYVNCCDVVARVPPECFDGPHFVAFFAELADFERSGFKPDLSASAIETVIGPVFRRIEPDWKFRHVGPARFLKSDGTLMPSSSSDADQRQEKREARGRYLRAESAFGAFVSAVSGQRVPFRDLADHTPINYLSAFTGREDPAK